MIKFTDLSKWDQLGFRVYICVALGEDPKDYDLTDEEVDYILYWKYDCMTEAIPMSQGDLIFPFGYRKPVRLLKGREIKITHS